MNRLLTAGTVIAILLSCQVRAADKITVALIQGVIDTTDAAARNRDTAGIGAYLGESFEKIIEFPHDKWMVKVRLDRQKYLDLIGEGWESIEAYEYQRENTVIHVMQDGMSGQSFSTVTEHVTLDGESMTSKFREHAVYALEQGRPVIVHISGHTLVGDTTPAPGQ